MQTHLLDSAFRLYRDTIIPELFEVLGPDSAIRIMEIFGGKNIYIPSFRDLSLIIRDNSIYEILSTSYGVEFHNQVSILSQKYDLPKPEVLAIYKKERTVRSHPEGVLFDTDDDKIILQHKLSDLERAMYYPQTIVRFQRTRTNEAVSQPV